MNSSQILAQRTSSIDEDLLMIEVLSVEKRCLFIIALHEGSEKTAIFLTDDFATCPLQLNRLVPWLRDFKLEIKAWAKEAKSDLAPPITKDFSDHVISSLRATTQNEIRDGSGNVWLLRNSLNEVYAGHASDKNWLDLNTVIDALEQWI